MLQLRKLSGVKNVQMVETDIPKLEEDEVLVKVTRSLISRGSELFGRYIAEQERPDHAMGYSDAGIVVDIGSKIMDIVLGQAMAMGSPHAEYASGKLGENGNAFPMPKNMSFETASFLPLVSGAAAWTLIPPMNPGETVVVMGQGLVGNLCAQAVRQRKPGRVITIDSIKLRCDKSRECGADEVINITNTDSVQAVLDMTNGKGADIVFECVGTAGGGKSFEQALKMVKRDGVVHLIGHIHQGGFYQLDNSIMNKMVIGGYYKTIGRLARLNLAAEMLMAGRINIEPLITHHIPGREADKAYHLLYQNPEEALGVVLNWEL